MNTSKQILALMLTIVVGAAGVGAQVCDISCAVQSHRVVASSEDQGHTSPSGHCHQQSPDSPSPEQPAPQKDHSSDCQSHNYAVELIKSGKNAVAEAFRKGDEPAADLFLFLAVSFNHLVMGNKLGVPDRSPPQPPTYSILRV